VFENNKKRVKSTLDQMLSQLPEKILLDIRKGELDLLYSIKYHLSAKGVLDRPTSYLNVEYGIIPTQTLYDEKKKSRVPELYEHILLRAAQINPAAAETFSFNLLLENSSLPNREELDVLLKHGTTFSKSLLVDRNYELSKITPVIDFIYENFSKTAQRKHLSDMSDEVLAIYAALPIVALLSSIPVEKKSTRKIQKQAILMPNTGKILEA
jgi:hypothetical protein